MDIEKSDFQLAIEESQKKWDELFAIKEKAEKNGTQCVFKDCEWPHIPDSRFKKFSTNVHFENVIFPRLYKGVWYFKNFIFEQGVTFVNCNFQSRYFHIQNCHFNYDVAFVRNTFSGVIKISTSTFKRDCRFSSCKLHTLSLGLPKEERLIIENNFEIDNCELDELVICNTTFNANFNLTNTSCNKQIYLVSSEFKSNVTFNSITLHILDGQNSFSITNCFFKGFLDFRNITFAWSLFMNYVTLQGVMNLTNITFETHAYFSIINVPGHTELRESNVTFKNKSDMANFFRFAKITAHAKGDLEKESEYHYKERCAQTSYNLEQSKFKCWPWDKKSKLRNLASLIFVEWIFGYGEKPWRILWIAVAAILGFACVYYLIDAAGKLASSFWEYLYFSVVTFTTLGYGDLKPDGGLARLATSIEALAGAFLIAIFVVSLARRYSR